MSPYLWIKRRSLTSIPCWIPEFPGIEFGLHLHISDDHWYEIVDAAYRQGCRRYDGVIGGLGGCPMADKELLGNLKTEDLLEYMGRNHITTGIDPAGIWPCHGAG